MTERDPDFRECLKERWGDRIGGVVLALTDEPQSTRAWADGPRGEEKLAEALDGFTVLHDRGVPGMKGNIDHIVIEPLVRQLDRVSRELLARAWSAGAGPGDALLTIDLDSTICETNGLSKESARHHGYTHVRGYPLN